MTPQEQQLISGLADRLRQAPAQQKDPAAEQFIRQHVASAPDAAYLLTQTALVQEQALNQAQQRIAELESQLTKAASTSTSTPTPAPTSFLGGAAQGPASGFGPSGPAASGQPAAGNPPTPARGSGGPASRPSATGAQGPQGRGGMGDFMRSAAAMAVGVAGGHLLFNGLQGMFNDDPAPSSASADAASGSNGDGLADTATDAAPDGGGWGAEQGVNEDALSGDPALWDEPITADSDAGWGQPDAGADGAAGDDAGINDEFGDDFAGDFAGDFGGDDDWG